MKIILLHQSLCTSEFDIHIYFHELTLIGFEWSRFVRATSIGHVHGIVRQIVQTHMQITGLRHRGDVSNGRDWSDLSILIHDLLIELVLMRGTDPIHAAIDCIRNAPMPVSQGLQVLVIEEVD